LGELSQLEELDISDNTVKFLPDSLMQCVLLRVLNLSHNKLAYIPAEIDQLKGLQVFLLEDNMFVSLPSSIGRLFKQQLTSFSLDWLKYIFPSPLNISINKRD
jgi:Leucine-rich repeat (LRR) protein